MKDENNPSQIARITWILLLAGLLVLASATLAGAETLHQSAEEGKTLFEGSCIACHTIGKGKLVGPDLQGVLERRDRDWLLNFITAPDRMIADNDPTALELLAEYNNIVMPNQGLNRQQAESLLAYLETQSSGAPAVPAVAAPLPSGDSERGSGLFSGSQRLENGGTPCIGCHSISGMAAMGGGSLGPDLTNVFQRYGDAPLAAALAGLPFPTMQGAFAGKPLSPQEQADLHLFFNEVQQDSPVPAASYTPQFWLIGAAGAVVLFGIMLIFWPRQRKSLSEKLRQGR